MLDLIIARNQRRWRPSKRFIFAWIASCFLHLAMLELLLEFPQLLRGGMYHRFRALGTFDGLPRPEAKEDNREWRMVAILKDLPMTAPSAATLRKLMYDWEKTKSGSPPIKVRWGYEQESIVKQASAPIPRTRKEDQQPLMPPLPVGDDPSSVPIQGLAEPVAVAGSTSVLPPGSPQLDSGSKGGIYLPPPGPDSRPKIEGSENKTPGSVSSAGARIGASSPQPKEVGKEMAARIFENEQQALRSPEGGLFDTKGFPLGEYANLIIQRIKERWFIPSHLRNAQGHTTIIFFINKDGQSTDARIVASSGIASLDLAALNAIMSSNPFPPLPKGFPGEHVGAKFIFSYNEPH